MAAFKDALNREWTVRLDAPTIAEVRKECGVDLAALDGQATQRLEADPVLLVNVLWVMVREQAGRLNVTDVQFGQSLVGDPIEHATDALLSAIIDFFPSRKRTLLRSLATKQAALMDRGFAMLQARIDDPQLETDLLTAIQARVDQELANALTGLHGATKPPATSDSGPTA